MTGELLVERCMRLLGYTNARGDIDRTRMAALNKNALVAVNMILADVLPIEGKDVVEINTLTATLPVNEDTAVRVMPYGVAMMMAQFEGDGDGQQINAAMYNQKRGSIHRENETVKDTIPVPELG